MMDPESAPISRRLFLKASSIAGSGLLLGLYLPGCTSIPPVEDPTATATRLADPSATPPPGPTSEATATDEPEPTPYPGDPNQIFEPDLLLKIDGTGAVIVTIARPDIGQGSRTALAMIIAEQLGADWQRVAVAQAPAGRSYGSQGTGGSTGIMQRYEDYSLVGAAAREMLIRAAAAAWGISKDTCLTENGEVVNGSSGERLPFGSLVEAAARLPVPSPASLRLKPRSEFTLIGSEARRIDNHPIISGQSQYGLDIRLPGMLYAVVARPPEQGASLADYAAAAALSSPGVVEVFEIDQGVAVVADSSWAALEGRRKLSCTWKPGENAALSTETMRAELLARLLPSNWEAEQQDPGVLSAVYEVPHYAHAPMEPMNCTVWMHDGLCEVWAPTQVPADALGVVRGRTRLSNEQIRVHIPLIGGGFGRRLETDYVDEALQIAMRLGAPLKLFWSREDDLQHDYYHPFSLHYCRMRLGSSGMPDIKTRTSSAIPSGSWRAVTNVQNAFARESFLDEMAAATGQDPLELRLERHSLLYQKVLTEIRQISDWGAALPSGRGRGIACHATWGMSPCAEVAEVEVGSDGSLRVLKIICVIDCGLVINPDLVRAQMEGGIVFALSAALKSSITLNEGRVQQSNFHNYPLLRMDETPQVEVHILPGGKRPFGVGEMSGPPAIPAVMNAIFHATGIRIRRLPLQKGDLRAQVSTAVG